MHSPPQHPRPGARPGSLIAGTTANSRGTEWAQAKRGSGSLGTEGQASGEVTSLLRAGLWGLRGLGAPLSAWPGQTCRFRLSFQPGLCHFPSSLTLYGKQNLPESWFPHLGKGVTVLGTSLQPEPQHRHRAWHTGSAAKRTVSSDLCVSLSRSTLGSWKLDGGSVYGTEMS